MELHKADRDLEGMLGVGVAGGRVDEVDGRVRPRGLDLGIHARVRRPHTHVAHRVGLAEDGAVDEPRRL